MQEPRAKGEVERPWLHESLTKIPPSCRSRLAGEEAREPCIALADAFAGKRSAARPAPTGTGHVYSG
ncbi:hypothetical protein C3L29_028445 [Pseudomonas sp. MWU12-2534b]|nr:hypothetical protein C3L29_028445 [Pseudomonas sp. MWU12-2534b]